MTKKIILVTLFVLFAGILIAGGINRTNAKADHDTVRGNNLPVAAAQEVNEGLNSDDAHAAAVTGQQGGQPAGQGLGNGGSPLGRNQKNPGDYANASASQQGIGRENGRTNEDTSQPRGQGTQTGQGVGGNGQGLRAQDSAEAHVSVIVEGTVAQVPAAGIDMIVATTDGEILVGTGPGYLQEQGFMLALDDRIQVTGFWEDGEFKAEAITRLADSATIALRDELGRPMWSGAAQGGRGRNQG